MFSLERVQQYIDIEQEPEPKDGGMPPAYWPASGKLEVEKLGARYSPVNVSIMTLPLLRYSHAEHRTVRKCSKTSASALTLDNVSVSVRISAPLVRGVVR
jgi:hypothetical protein